MNTTTESKLYCLESFREHFYAGHLNDGTQAFMSTDYSNLIAVLFDAEGKYLKSLVREISQEAPAAVTQAPPDDDWPWFSKAWNELDSWAAELGFTPGVIAVQKFCLPEYELCIHDLPEGYQELLDSGRELDEDEKEEIQMWQAETDYVLVWGQEYHVDREGKVVFT